MADEYTIDPAVNAAPPAPAPRGGSEPLYEGALSREAVNMIAEKEGANPDIAWAIYSQESGRGRNARTSVDNARGGFQVIPDTYREVMGTDEGQDDPIRNAVAGIRYLAKIQKKVGDDPALVAAGYFSGHDNVRRDGIINASLRDGNGKDVASYARDVAARVVRTEKPAGAPTPKVEAPPEAPKARPWAEIAGDPAFRGLTPEARAEVRDSYFAQAVAPAIVALACDLVE